MSVQKPENSSKIYSAEICEQEVITEPIEKLNFEYIDEVKVSEPEIIQQTVKYQGIINTENISPPHMTQMKSLNFQIIHRNILLLIFLPRNILLIQKLN